MNNDNSLLTANPRGGYATIEQNFIIQTEEDALYFCWVIEKWISEHEESPESQFHWIFKQNNFSFTLTLKLSSDEEYYDFNYEMVRETEMDIVLVDCQKNAHFKSEIGNLSHFSSKVFDFSDWINLAIQQGTFQKVRVPIFYEEYYYQEDASLKKRLWELSHAFRGFKIDNILKEGGGV